MHSMTFELETITPMFMGGYKQNEFELRPPSFKGMMRFWWRAYYWGSSATSLSPKELEQQEGNIFGTTSNNGQKSSFSLRIQNLRKKQSPRDELRKYDEQLYTYLTYGAKCSAYDAKFDLVLDFSDTTLIRDVIISLYLLSLFGSLGAKSRNGFGNIVVKNPEIFHDYGLSYPFSFIEVLSKLICNTNIPNFSAFSEKMKLFALKKQQNTAIECHAELGKIYKESKQKLDAGLSCEKRQYIAAPITVKKRGESRIFTQSSKRLAKPYFLRVLPEGNKFQGYILYLPSKICRTENNDNVKAEQYRKTFNLYLQQHGMKEVTIW